MNPTNKAIELIEKFLPNVYCYSGSDMLTNTYNDRVAISNAKIQALILVEEVLKTVDATHKYLFYKDVKNILETNDFYFDGIKNKITLKNRV